MIPEIGHYALVLALGLALVQGTVPLVGAHKGDASLMAVARTTAAGQFVFLTAAFLALTWAYVTSDFSVANVVQNSHTLKPMLYKVSGVWANHEGSMLLWILMLSLYGLMVAAFGRNLPPALRARVLAVQGLIAFGFLAFILFTSNPFLRVVPPAAEGQGLNPLLQDPGLAFHPPFLYLGYVGFSMAFSFAIAALIEGRVDPAWARWVRPWTLVAWCGLTVGIAMGSWWAYYELGWGGWWFWDPVENASFMPWLIGTALLHSSIVVEKRDTMKSWTILLAILAFSLSLLGTFLVRSGVLTSVHTFATDPERGVFILGLLGVVVGGALILYAIRAPALKGGGLFAPISREGALVLNNLLLCTGTVVVFFGTLIPLVLDAVNGPKISVGPPFYNMVFVPFMVVMLVMLVIGAMLPWKRGDLAGVLSRLKFVVGICAVVFLVVWYFTAGNSVFAALGIALAAWLVLGSLVALGERLSIGRVSVRDSLRRARSLPRATYGMVLAHAGVGIMVAGITASSAWQTERVQFMKPGETVDVAGYTFNFRGAGEIKGPNYVATQGGFLVMHGDKFITVLLPEKRSYPAERSNTTEAAIYTSWSGDLYAVLGEPDGKGGYATRLYHNPLVPWIWFGAVIMALGGLVSLTDRRLRVGAPRRAASPQTGAPTAGPKTGPDTTPPAAPVEA